MNRPRYNRTLRGFQIALIVIAASALCVALALTIYSNQRFGTPINWLLFAVLFLFVIATGFLIRRNPFQR